MDVCPIDDESLIVTSIDPNSSCVCCSHDFNLVNDVIRYRRGGGVRQLLSFIMVERKCQRRFKLRHQFENHPRGIVHQQI